MKSFLPSVRCAAAGGLSAGAAVLLAMQSLAQAATNDPSVKVVQLRDVIQQSLQHNRTLQIERINPEVTRAELSGAYGVYDPVFLAQARRENVTDSGAFDPANPGVDSGFDSNSDLMGIGLTGLLPSGLLYGINGNYGHSRGSRNFLNFDSHRAVAGITLQQPLLKNLWIDQPRLTIQVNRRNLQISEEGVRLTAMTILNLVQQGYADLVLAWDNLRIQRELLTTRESFLRNIRRQVELGSLTVLEERVARAESARVLTDLITASNVVALAGNHLRTLMGVTSGSWDEGFLQPQDRGEVPGEGAFALHASWQRAMDQRPDLVQLVKGMENAESNLRFRRNQLFPALDIVGAYGRRGASSIQAFPPDQPDAPTGEALDQIRRGDAPNDMVGLIFSMPLTRTAERAGFRAGKHLKAQAELLVRQKEELILREISDAIHNVRFSEDRLKAARFAAAAAGEALKAEEEKLTGGRSSINFVLQFQAALAAARMAEVQAESEHRKAVSQVHFAEGSILERHRITFDFR